MKITSQSGQHGVDRPIIARRPEHEIYDLMHDLAATGSLPPVLLPFHEEAKERVLDVSDMGTQVDVDDFRPMDFEQQMSVYVEVLKDLLVANGLTYVLNDLEDSWLRRATKEFPASQFHDSHEDQKCSRWGCDKAATACRKTGSGHMGACGEHKAEMTKDD